MGEKAFWKYEEQMQGMNKNAPQARSKIYILVYFWTTCLHMANTLLLRTTAILGGSDASRTHFYEITQQMPAYLQKQMTGMLSTK